MNTIERSLPHLVALTLAVLAPALASAQAPGEGTGRTYAVGKLGVVVPQHDDLSGYDNGFAIEGGVGHRFNPNFAAELTLGRFSLSGSESGVEPGIGVVTVSSEVVAYPLLATGKLIAPLEKGELYALFGAGVYFLSGDLTVSAPGYIPAAFSDSDNPIAAHLGAGFSFELSPKTSLGLEVRYILGKTALFQDVSGQSSHFDSVMISAGLGFNL